MAAQGRRGLGMGSVGWSRGRAGVSWCGRGFLGLGYGYGDSWRFLVWVSRLEVKIYQVPAKNVFPTLYVIAFTTIIKFGIIHTR